MLQHLSLLAAWLLVTAAAIPASAQPLSRTEIAKRCKAATAFLKIDEKRSATAFCVHKSGYFVTAAQPVADSTEELELVVKTGENFTESRSCRVAVIRTDKESDLALLEVRGHHEEPFPTLKVKNANGLSELTELISVGFLTENLQRKNDDVSVTVLVARVSALRRVNNQLRRIQIDAPLFAGNEGSPLLDSHGDVVAVVTEKLFSSPSGSIRPVPRPTQLQHRPVMATPGAAIQRLLSTPQLSLSPQLVSTTSAREEVELNVRYNDLLSTDRSVDLALELQDETGGNRRIPLQRTGDRYTASVVLLPGKEEIPRVRIDATFTKGRLSCTSFERTVRIGGKELPLTTLTKSASESSWVGKSKSGTLVEATNVALELPVMISDRKFTFDFSKASTFACTPVAMETVRSVKCDILVLDGEEIQRRIPRTISVGAPPRNILAVIHRTRTIAELTPDGRTLRKIVLPKGDRTSQTEVLRDIVQAQDGTLFAFDGTFDPRLAVFKNGKWSRYQHSEGWSLINNVSFGGIAIFRNKVFVSTMPTANSRTNGIHQFTFSTAGVETSRFLELNQNARFSPLDLTCGLDGKLYAAHDSTVNVYDPETGDTLKTITLPVQVRAVVANEQGVLFGATWNGEIIRFSRDGQVEKKLHCESGSLTDIDIDPRGRIVAGTRLGDIVLSDANLKSFKTIKAAASFVAFGSLAPVAN